MTDDCDLTKQTCPQCGLKGVWIRAEQDALTCYLRCAFCLCHIVLYKYDDYILETFEEDSVS